MVCLEIGGVVNKVDQCVLLSITCGSIVTSTSVSVIENDNDTPEQAAPSNTTAFSQQIAKIQQSLSISKSLNIYNSLALLTVSYWIILC